MRRPFVTKERELDIRRIAVAIGGLGVPYNVVRSSTAQQAEMEKQEGAHGGRSIEQNCDTSEFNHTNNSPRRKIKSVIPGIRIRTFAKLQWIMAARVSRCGGLTFLQPVGCWLVVGLECARRRHFSKATFNLKWTYVKARIVSFLPALINIGQLREFDRVRTLYKLEVNCSTVITYHCCGLPRHSRTVRRNQFC